ncbi:MAG: hypothetical protein [Caudoviricetes sp.]|nr:MAG: hypothetical protein [Caudoviricetes sp.]
MTVSSHRKNLILRRKKYLDFNNAHSGVHTYREATGLFICAKKEFLWRVFIKGVTAGQLLFTTN